MPFFKSTYNILVKTDEDEVFDINSMDSDELKLPPKKRWDYKRPLEIEDVDIWEVIYESTGGIGVYASWCPYAEFYMLTTGWNMQKNKYGVNEKSIETFYGPNAMKKIYHRALQLDIPLSTNEVWVDDSELWLYTN